MCLLRSPRSSRDPSDRESRRSPGRSSIDCWIGIGTWPCWRRISGKASGEPRAASAWSLSSSPSLVSAVPFDTDTGQEALDRLLIVHLFPIPLSLSRSSLHPPVHPSSVAPYRISLPSIKPNRLPRRHRRPARDLPAQPAIPSHALVARLVLVRHARHPQRRCDPTRDQHPGMGQGARDGPAQEDRDLGRGSGRVRV